MSSVPVGHLLRLLLLRMLNIIKTGQHGTHLYSHSEGESLAPWSTCGQLKGGISGSLGGFGVGREQNTA